VSDKPLLKIKATTAAEICAHFELKKEARSLLLEGIAPHKFLEALLTNKQYLAGIDFLSHALLPRDAIWWGCLCFQHAVGSDLSAQDMAACKAAVRWVYEPTEENRAATKSPAEAAGVASPAGGLATAAFNTGGNIAPPKSHPMSPPPFAPAKAVAGAIKLASTKSEPIKIAGSQRSFVELGIGIAEGRFMLPDIRDQTAGES
jgi:hypothetical protein